MCTAPPSHAVLLDDRNPVRRPASMGEAVRDTNRQTNGRDRLAGEVLCVKDDDVAQVACGIAGTGPPQGWDCRGRRSFPECRVSASWPGMPSPYSAPTRLALRATARVCVRQRRTQFGEGFRQKRDVGATAWRPAAIHLP